MVSLISVRCVLFIMEFWIWRVFSCYFSLQLLLSRFALSFVRSAFTSPGATCSAPPWLNPHSPPSREQEAVGCPAGLEGGHVLLPGVFCLLPAHCWGCPGSAPLAGRYSAELAQATPCPFLALKLGY